MPDMSAPLKLGSDCWNWNTDWPSFLAAMQLSEHLGYDSLWVPDHVLPPVGDPDGPIFEPYMALGPVAALTTKPTIGLMVGANTYRNPAMVAKMVTTLDHISGGRAILAIGSAWSEIEHTQFGFEFGASPGERLRWLREALPVMRGMLDGTRPSAAGDHYAMKDIQNAPAPIQERLPLLIGGGGPKVTLRLVAEYADANNLEGTIEDVRRKERLLMEHCEAVGRDERDIERTVAIGVPTIRDSRDAATSAHEATFRHNNATPGPDDPAGTPEDLVEYLAPYLELGYRHLIFYFPAPFDEETMTRLAHEVRPRLQAMLDA